MEGAAETAVNSSELLFTSELSAQEQIDETNGDGPLFKLSDFVSSPGSARTPNLYTEPIFFDHGSSSLRIAGPRGRPLSIQLEGNSSGCGEGRSDLFSGAMQLMPSETVDTIIGLTQQGLDAGNLENLYCQMDMQSINTARNGLPELPPSLAPIDMISSLNGQHTTQEQTVQGTNILLLQETIDELRKTKESFNNAAEVMRELNSTISRRENLVDAKFTAALEAFNRVGKQLTDLVMNFGEKKPAGRKGIARNPPFNWMFGHGVEPRTGTKLTADQTRFERFKTAVRKNAIWFIYNATDKDLMDTWIASEEHPDGGATGLHIREMLMNKKEMSEEMANVLIKLLRHDEVNRELGTDGHCHYVMHHWAMAVMKPGADMYKCEKMFIEPSIKYEMESCDKVVAMILLNECWCSLSIDIKKATTYLIHPSLSDKDPHAVMNLYHQTMEMLTTCALAHMKKLARSILPDKPWEYVIALKGEHVMKGPETGISTAYYSIPKSNQFLVVSPETTYLAKMTFIYNMIKFCYPVMKKLVQERTLPKSKTKKRSRNTLESFYYESDKESDRGSSAPINTSLNARVNTAIDFGLRLT